MSYYRNYGNRRSYGNGNDACCEKKEVAGCCDVKSTYDCDRKPACDCDLKKACDCDKKPACDYGVSPASDCGCGKAEGSGDCYVKDEMKGMPIGMAYVPWQNFRKLYEVCEGYSKGTIFKELNLDFMGRRCN